MTQRFLPVFMIAALAAVLWVVPSIVSQGMVTAGERFAHADQDLVEPGQSSGKVRAALRQADANVETALFAKR